jgi:hypothetical protein
MNPDSILSIHLADCLDDLVNMATYKLYSARRPKLTSLEYNYAGAMSRLADIIEAMDRK